MSPLLALSAVLALVTGCGEDSETDGSGGGGGGGAKVVATTTWEGAFAKAAGAEDVKVLVPHSVGHAPDYDPKPSDLTTVASADFVLYAAFEPYAEKIKEAAGSKAKLIEVGLDNDAAKVRAEVERLAGLFGTESAGATWNEEFDTEYARLGKDLKAGWPGGKRPTVVSQVFTTWAAKMAGADTVGTYGPEAVSPKQLADLSAKKPDLVLGNAHMSSGEVLPGSGARQVDIANYPDGDLDLLKVYRDAAADWKKAVDAS
ncbi:ABC transporter substrate-binding protein [Streptomyces sp. NPDC059816]|uniref:ABC transporter substrate-binding protein n=2 Tax=unclassified Streptomyces TaxID=2593676 RepID=UPI003661C1C4